VAASDPFEVERSARPDAPGANGLEAPASSKPVARPSTATGPPGRANSRVFETPLLTPEEIAARLQIERTDVARWMRRLFIKHQIAFIDARGNPRASEAQYLQLLKALQCSPSAHVEARTSTIFAAQSRSALNASKSQNSVREQLRRMLHRT
jgi:hypothetical protein